MQAANTLVIGTMGFGGQVTLLGCKVGMLNRLPASFLFQWLMIVGPFVVWE